MAVEARSVGLILSTSVAGAVLGALDAIDVIAGGFAAGLGFLDRVAVITSAAAAVGLAGAAAGLIMVAALGGARRVGVVWDPGVGLAVGSRPILGAEGVALVATTVTLFGVGGLAAMTWVAATGTGRGHASVAATIAALSLAASVGLVWFLVRRPGWRPPYKTMWLVALVGLWWLEARAIYSFSRASAIGWVHGGLLLSLVGLAGAGMWIALPGLRGAVARRRRAAKGGLAAGCLVAVVGLLALECLAPHRVRLVLHDRTSLAFRPLSLVPIGAGRRLAAITGRWRERCGDAGPAARPPPAPPAAEPLRGVVLILIDSLRGDRLGAERSGQLLTSNLSQLAARGASFTRAYTPIPGTREAITALLGGRPGHPLDERDNLVAALRPAGVETRAVAGHANLGIARSMFDVYDDRASRERFEAGQNALTSKQIAARASAHLASIEPGRRFLLLVHFIDPHAHYVANPIFDFGDSEAERYDAEVAYTDHWIGAVLAAVREAPDIGVVAVSDHGDELWEHRYKRHKLRLYDESTRVPLIVFDPRVAEGRRIDREVSVADVAPTLLEMLGVGAPSAMQGRSVLPAVSGAKLASRRVVLRSSDSDRWGVVHERRKLIVDRVTGVLEYYDLAADPGETHNLADRRPLPMRELSCSLHRWMQSGLRPATIGH